VKVVLDPGRKPFAFCSWLLALGCSPLAAGSWLLAVGRKPLAVRSWQFALGRSQLALCSWLFAVAFPISCASDEGSWRSGNGELAVSSVAAPAPVNVGSPDSATMAVYAIIANVSAAADTLVAVETDAARNASVHGTMDHGGSKMMMPVPAFVVPPGDVVRLMPGATHVMLEGLRRQFVPGDTLPLTFVFRRGGRIAVNASVLFYEQLQDALTP
jgi:copper(I)-binding protein